MEPLLHIEARVLGAILADPTTLDQLPDLESRDFQYARYRWVFDAMRNLQAANAPITMQSVLDHIENLDKERGTAAREVITPLLLAELVAWTERYTGDECITADTALLRHAAEENADAWR